MFVQDDLTDLEQQHFLWKTKVKTIELKLAAVIRQIEQIAEELKALGEK